MILNPDPERKQLKQEGVSSVGTNDTFVTLGALKTFVIFST